ncbi:MAG: hypothetical protein N2235_14060 [Fischerella sp.]|nr:hypothetical protein [Fischerella sp.]
MNKNTNGQLELVNCIVIYFKLNKRVFDLDIITAADLEEPSRLEPLSDFKTLDKLLQTPSLLPPGIEVQLMQDGKYKFSIPGMKETLRVTTKCDYFDQYPGSPLFPIFDGVRLTQTLF